MNDQDKLRAALALLEAAQDNVRQACRLLQGTHGPADQYEAMSRLHDTIAARWHDLDKSRTQYALR